MTSPRASSSSSTLPLIPVSKPSSTSHPLPQQYSRALSSLSGSRALAYPASRSGRMRSAFSGFTAAATMISSRGTFYMLSLLPARADQLSSSRALRRE